MCEFFKSWEGENKPGLSSEDDFYPYRGSLNGKRLMQGDPISTHINTHTQTDKRAIISYFPIDIHNVHILYYTCRITKEERVSKKVAVITYKHTLRCAMIHK